MGGINENRILDSFPMVKEFTEELDSGILGDVLNDFHVHLLSLLDSFNCYFPEELHEKIKDKFWVVDPTLCVGKASLSDIAAV